MKYLLDKDGIQVLQAFCMADSLFAFDYDGTLAPIVEDIHNANMRKSTSIFLSDLASLSHVALISGRARNDILKFIPKKIEYVIGNHGLEGIPGDSQSLERAESACKKWYLKLQNELKMDGIFLENKVYSLSIHYRKSLEKRAAKLKILEVLDSLTPSPRIIMGKCVINLVSPGAPHKGIALLEVMLNSGCRSAVYFGDDDNDEDVFSLGEESLLTVRIGKNSSSSALFYLNSQDEIDEAIKVCLSSLIKSGKTSRKHMN